MFDRKPPNLCAGVFGAEPQWRPRRHLSRGAVPEAAAPWLFDTASLTRRLRACCPGCFAVRVIAQGRRRPDFNERRLLGMSAGELALVREVELQCRGRPWVFARTVIPLPTLAGRRRRLAHLGTRPLGEMLFASRSMRRHEVQVACIQPQHALYCAAAAALQPRPAQVWGRRSIFELEGRPLLVSEVFLPTLLGARGPDGAAVSSASMNARR